MRVSGLRLRVADPEHLARFYENALGMRAYANGAVWRVGYRGADADLILEPGGGHYVHDRGQRYWKIGITLPDVDAAASALIAAGVEVSEPYQFGDIGYMCHLADPEGFVIELLQHDFEANKPTEPGDPTRPFDRGCIGQITLRTGEIDAEAEVCAELGMRLLSVQDVPAYGFDLHFFAFTDDVPPDPDLWSVNNREWLWKRPYTTLEFQHVDKAQFVSTPDFRGIEIEGLPQTEKDAFGDPLLPR